MNETTKKHFSTKVKSMILSMILLLAIAVQIEPVYAAKTATWSSSKIPGSDITNGTQRSLTYYTGDISFVATKLGGDCS